jgi:transketolase
VRECFWVSETNEDAAMANNLDALLARAKSIRQDILKMTTEAGSGHPSSSLSAVEIVTARYFDGFLRHDSINPHWPDRDRFILSKGHAAPVLYAALAQAGYFPHDEIMTLRKLGSPLEGHPNMKRLAGVEASTGSLGQGLSIGIGHALAARIDNHVQCV